MKVYLAAQFSRQEELSRYRDELIGMGMESCSRWLDEENENRSRFEQYARSDEQDIRECDVFVLFSTKFDVDDRLISPSELVRGGRHYETGYAAALRKFIYIVGHRENIFHEQFRNFKTWEACLTFLQKWTPF